MASVFRETATVCKSQWFLFRLRPDVILNAQFVGLTGFYSIYRRIYFPSSDYSLRTPMVFILFIAVSVFRMAHRATALHSDKAVESSLS